MWAPSNKPSPVILTLAEFRRQSQQLVGVSIPICNKSKKLLKFLSDYVLLIYLRSYELELDDNLKNNVFRHYRETSLANWDQSKVLTFFFAAATNKICNFNIASDFQLVMQLLHSIKRLNPRALRNFYPDYITYVILMNVNEEKI